MFGIFGFAIDFRKYVRYNTNKCTKTYVCFLKKFLQKFMEGNFMGRRNCKNNQMKIVIMFAVIFVFVLFAGLGPVSGILHSGSTVVEANHQLSEMKYKVVQIEEGDSLWSIAEDNMDPGFSDIHDYIYEVKRCNQLDSDNIISGNYLMIPYYEDLTPAVANAD